MNPKLVMRILAKTDIKTKLRLAKVLPKFGKADEVTKCMLCPNMCLHVCPVFDVERRLTVSPSVKARLAYFAESEAFDALFHCLPCDACKNACPIDISVDEVLAPFRSLGSSLVEKAVKKFERDVLTARKDVEEREGRLLYFPGCRTFESGLYDITVEVLEKLGVDFAVRSDVVCCGMPYYELGLVDKFKVEIDKLKAVAAEYEGVISNCPHCVHVMRENGIRAAHIIHVLKPVKLGGDISYHDPCILARRLGVVDEPRRLLEGMGFVVHEPIYGGKETYCCGFGGIYRFVDEENAKKIAERRREHFEYEIVTACPACSKALDAKDIVELVWEGL